MVELIKKLTALDGTTGDEGRERDLILSEIRPF